MAAKNLISKNTGVDVRRVSMDEVQPGMVLARPVTNTAGMVIAGEGLILDDTVIHRLQQLGKEGVYVEGRAITDVTQSLAEQQRDLDRRFRKVQHDARLMKIRDVIKAYVCHLAEETAASTTDSVQEKGAACPDGLEKSPQQESA